MAPCSLASPVEPEGAADEYANGPLTADVPCEKSLFDRGVEVVIERLFQFMNIIVLNLSDNTYLANRWAIGYRWLVSIFWFSTIINMLPTR